MVDGSHLVQDLGRPYCIRVGRDLLSTSPNVCMLIECPTHHMGRLDRFGQSTLYSFAGELLATNGSEQTQDSGHFGDSLATL
jgi:hypothetical protein